MLNPVSSLLPQKPITVNPAPKLDLKTIFRKMEKYVCQVSTLRGRCSGTLIGGSVVLVPFHSIAITKIKENEDGTANYNIHSVEVIYNDTTYTAVFANGLKLDTCQFYDCCAFQIVDDDFTSLDPLYMNTVNIEPGTKVYFAGFPLIQQTPSFHKAVVSSVEIGDTTSIFSIDAPVMPGNSGGPVFIQENGEIYLVGIIFSELATIDYNFLRQKNTIKAHLSEGGIYVGIDYSALLSKMIDTIFDNISTGIGKVMSIKHIKDLTSGSNPPQGPSPFSIGLPVTSDEYLPGQLATDPNYLDWYHRRVKGKGLCVKIFGRMLDANIDKHEEKILRAYYETNILSQKNKGHEKFQLTPEGQYRNLCSKILEAKPKGFNTNKVVWKSKLISYKQSLPHLTDDIDRFISKHFPGPM